MTWETKSCWGWWLVQLPHICKQQQQQQHLDTNNLHKRMIDLQKMNRRVLYLHVYSNHQGFSLSLFQRVQNISTCTVEMHV